MIAEKFNLNDFDVFPRPRGYAIIVTNLQHYLVMTISKICFKRDGYLLVQHHESHGARLLVSGARLLVTWCWTISLMVLDY